MNKAKVITITYHSVSTGKTTLAVNLAAYLANYDINGKFNRKSKDKFKVLLIDLAPHSNSTKYLGIYEKNVPTFREIVKGEATIDQTLISYTRSVVIGEYEIHCMRSCESLNSINMEDFEFYRQQGINYKAVLDTVLRTSGALEYYDYIIIDCPPATKELYANGIYAGDYFLCPTTIRGADYEEVFCTLDEIKNHKNRKKDTKLLGIVINMQVGNRTTAEIIGERNTDTEGIDQDEFDMVELYRREAPVYECAIPQSKAINNSYLVQDPLVSYYYYRTKTKRGKRENRDFINLVNEIYNDIKQDEIKKINKFNRLEQA